MADDEDPFDRLEEAAGDRRGDPFDELDDGADDESTADAPDETPGPSSSAERSATEQPPSGPAPDDPGGNDATTPDETDWFEEARASADSPPGIEAGDPETAAGTTPEETDPIGETVSGPDQRQGDPFESVEDLFEQMDVEGIDPDSVWENLADAQGRGSVSQHQGRTYAEVSKHSFCEHCPHFSDPPEIECNHEGTQILEFLDMDTVRVVDCPIVAERRELEEHE